jgi:pyruvate-formate lyase-activating enzyme
LIDWDGVQVVEHSSTIEEVYAQSLQLLQPTFLDYEKIKPRTLSILPIAKGCQAACVFCFSEASASAEQEQAKLSLELIERIAAIAKQRGAERFVITGGGEPGLVPHRRLCEYMQIGARHLGKVVLITNGHHLAKVDDIQRNQLLQDYAAAGLEVLAVSHHHDDSRVNTQIMNLTTDIAPLLRTWVARRERWPSLRLRLTCVLQRGGIESADDIGRYIDWASKQGVTEFCFKELYVSSSVESVYHRFEANRWSHDHQIPLAVVLEFAERHGFVQVAQLPWGAPVFRGPWGERAVQLAAYTEPSLYWERAQGIARSWNLMADGECLVSLEDRRSRLDFEERP